MFVFTCKELEFACIYVQAINKLTTPLWETKLEPPLHAMYNRNQQILVSWKSTQILPLTPMRSGFDFSVAF